MKIIHLNSERTWRGGEQQMCYLAQGLMERGHESHVVCRPGSPCAEKASALGLTVREFLIRGDVDFSAGGKLARLADEVGADILHAHTARTHLAAVRAKRISSRHPKCVVHRRVDFSIHKLPLRLSGLKYRSGVDRYIAITDAVKNVMISDGIPAELIEVIHSSTDLRRFDGVHRKPGLRDELSLPEKAPIVGAVGALVGHKGQEYLIRSAAIVLKQMPEVHFLLLGEGERREELEGLARTLGIAGHFHMPGFRSDVPECLAEFSLFCMSSWGEGMGSSALEAMAMRLPVVATLAGGLPEVIVPGKTGLLVPPRASDALAGAILRLLRNPEESLSFGEAGRKRVEEEFSVSAMVDRTLKLYERLIEGND
jgi:glycosyltransferase involved in cell wall biosynthesis